MGKITSEFRLASRMAVAISKTLLRHQQSRRKLMFAVSVAAMLVTFLGFTLLEGFLSDHPLLFAFYWLLCAGLVIFMVLLAIYDLATVRGSLNTRTDAELADVMKDIENEARSGDGENDKK